MSHDPGKPFDEYYSAFVSNLSSPEAESTAPPSDPATMDFKTLKEPRTMVLLGKDFDSKCYHWEGPYGLPFQTEPDMLHGWVKGWTRKILDRSDPNSSGQYLLHLTQRDGEPKFYLLDPETETYRTDENDDSVFHVVSTLFCWDKMTLPKHCLFQPRERPNKETAVLKEKESPYTRAAWQRPKIVDVKKSK